MILEISWIIGKEAANEVKMNNAQNYVLKWNNYNSNLMEVFDEMLKNEHFCDVTLVCDHGVRFKCHKMLLAACSKFFEEIFTNIPCEQYAVVVLRDIRSTDMRYILEYIYTGKVNIEHAQIESIFAAAKSLMIKGLWDGPEKDVEAEPIDESAQSRPSSGHGQTPVHSSSSMHSPPHSTNSSMYKNPYTNMYSKMNASERGNLSMPLWHVPGLPMHQPPVPESPSSNHFPVPSPPTMIPPYESPNSEVYHHRRKKFSSMMMPKDTPILRTVLGQGHADSSEPVSLVMNHADSKEEHEHDSMKKHMKEEPSEDESSRYSDHHSANGEDIKPNLPQSSPFCVSDMRLGSSSIANYVPPQKPEWKRYKQYSRENLNCAIQAVSAGTMSALQAAKKFNVPSRTLYDKVKKLGIVTSKIYRKGSNGNFRYPMNRQTESPFRMSENEESPVNNNTRNFLQQAIDNSGENALNVISMVAVMQAAAAAKHKSQSLGQGFDPSTNPELLRYIQQRMEPRSPSIDDEEHETNGRSEQRNEDVEDLSLNKRQEGVIVSPMHQVTARMKTEEARMETNEEKPRGICVEGTA